MKKIKHTIIDDIVNLMLKSSNPYTDKLSKKDNVLAAIDLAKLAKNFADSNQHDEAMNISSEQWIDVINKLNQILNETK